MRTVRKGFTLIELLVVISVVVMLIAILLPALRAARSAATSIACAGNQRQLGLITNYYTNDFNDVIVPQQLHMVEDNASNQTAGRSQDLLYLGGYLEGGQRIDLMGSTQSPRLNPLLVCQGAAETRYREHVHRDSYENQAGPRLWVSLSFNTTLGQIRGGKPRYTDARDSSLKRLGQIRAKVLSDVFHFDCGVSNLPVHDPYVHWYNPGNRNGQYWQRFAHGADSPNGTSNGAFLDGSVRALQWNAFGDDPETYQPFRVLHPNFSMRPSF